MKNYKFDEDEVRAAWHFRYSDRPEKDVEKSWIKFRKRLNQEKWHHRNRYGRAVFAGLGMAVLCVSYFFSYIYNPTIIRDNFSLTDEEVKLPDGSVVLLKQGSEIRYKKYFRTSRGVELQGKAFFEVVGDGPEFIVATRFTTTKVLGTSFYVKEKEKSKVVEIFLYTGFVEFTGAGKAESWCLSPGENLRYSEGEVEVKKFDMDSWFPAEKDYIDINSFELENGFSLLRQELDLKVINPFSISRRANSRTNRRT